VAVDALLLVLSFALGSVLSRLSLCAVAGVQQLIGARDGSGAQRLALAASAAGATLLLLALALPGRVLLPGHAPFHAGIIGGGLLLGVGALLNGGCYLGSVLYLGCGNLNFLFTLAGIACGSRWTESVTARMSTVGALRVSMGSLPLAGLAVFALVLLVLLGRRRLEGRWLAAAAGLLGGLVYARHPGWSYGAVLESLTHGALGAMDWLGNLSALLLFAGALAGAWLRGRFRLLRPSWPRSLRCLAGGMVMGCGAVQVPGGNDMLLLWAIPGLTNYGLLAYASMLAAIGAGVAAAALWQRNRRPGTVN